MWVSSSWDNNYEIVEFVAPESGIFEIGVQKQSSTTEGDNQVGIAWAKDAIYLPDLRNQDGWVSELYVRNDGPLLRTVPIHYFDADGEPTYSDPSGDPIFDQCVLSPNQWCWIPVDGPDRIPPESTGWAIVGGGEDVSVVVETQKNDKTERINSTGRMPAGGSSSPGWGEVGSTLYAPAVKRQYDGRSSTIHLVNTGMQGTTIVVYYYDDSGVARWGGSQWLSPNGRATFSPDGGAAVVVTLPAPSVRRELSPSTTSTWRGTCGNTTMRTI
jgi:hypothetical protein